MYEVVNYLLKVPIELDKRIVVLFHESKLKNKKDFVVELLQDRVKEIEHRPPSAKVETGHLDKET